MDDNKRNNERSKRQKKRKKKKIGKSILIFISILVLGVAAFVITMKLCNPDMDLLQIIPVDSAVQYVKEDVLKQTTTLPETTTEEITTRPPNYDYAESIDFTFDTSLQGNQVGNLLNNSKGAVTFSSAYNYFSINNSGIYRFEPVEEVNANVRVDNSNYKYLNVLGDYIYYINTDTNKLIRSNVTGGEDKEIADNIAFIYLYSDKLFFVGTDNTVGFIKIDDFSKTVLYTAQSTKELKFVGISLYRIFFTEFDTTTKTQQYITVSLKDSADKQFFRDDTNDNEILNMQLECGYMYYYQRQADNTYNLVRQKFGSTDIVTLLTNCTYTDYPSVVGNRVYYTELDGSTVKAMELNMNNKNTKVMLGMGGADASATAAVCYANSYTFLVGAVTSSGDVQYRASSIYTSSSNDNTIAFYDGAWHY